MLPNELEELVALDAAGALGSEEQHALHERLRSAGHEVRQAAAQLYDAAAAAMTALSGQDVPAAGVRERLFERLFIPEGGLPAGQGEWAALPIPGFQVKVLSVDRERNISILLMRAAEGATYPSHHHHGPEGCYVLAGVIEIAGERSRAGDYLYSEPGTDHAPLVAVTAAELLLIVPASDYA